jgi:DNA repair protein RadC
LLRFAFGKKYGTQSELQNIPAAGPKASPSFSVSEKLVRYGSSALSGVEYLTLLVGKKSVALALIRHFGSLKSLSRASFQELRQFLPQRKAEAVVAALSMSSIAETEHARSKQLDNPESIHRACAMLLSVSLSTVGQVISASKKGMSGLEVFCFS